MAENREGSHTVFNIQYHLVWVTKYRYHVVRGEVAERARELIRQSCMAREIKILKGHVSKDHVHLLVSSPPALSPA
ncbi:MAG TPA: IS200/IS605 family transposase, partial [Longimicrobium sp.]|nr:IS200/IS605 family transposase [Longimicrobium sp.]